MLRGVTEHFWTCIAGLLCLGAVPAPGNVALVYDGPQGCPNETVFRQRIADLYDFQEPFVLTGKPASFVLRVTIEHVGTTYLGAVKLLNADGTVRVRFVELHENCDALVYDVVHRARIVIQTVPPPGPTRDPEAEKKLWRRLDGLEEGKESQDEQIKALDRKIKALNEQIARIARREREKMDLAYSVFTGALLTANLTANVGPGVWVGADLRIAPISIGLEFRAVLPSRVVVGPYDLDLSQFVGLLTPCGRYFIFFGCAVAGAGAQIDHDSNFVPTVPATAYTPLVQLGGRVGVEVPLGESRFAIQGWSEVLYSTPSSAFAYDNRQFVTVRPDVSVFFGLGLVVKLGKQEGAK